MTRSTGPRPGRRGWGLAALVVPTAGGVCALGGAPGQPALELVGFTLLGGVAGCLAGAVTARLLEIERENGCDGTEEPDPAPLTWRQRLPFAGAWFPRAGEPKPEWYEVLPLISMFTEAWRWANPGNLCPRIIRPAAHAGMALAGATLFAALGSALGPTWLFAGAAFLAFMLLIASTVDARIQIIPDEVNLAAFGGMLAFAGVTQLAWLAGLLADGPLHARLGYDYPYVYSTIGLGSALGGAAAAAGTLYVLAELGRFLAGRDAVGGGDIKLMACIGALVGWKGALATLYVSVWIAGPVGLLLRLTGRARSTGGFTQMAYGPALAAAALVVVCVGHGRIFQAMLWLVTR